MPPYLREHQSVVDVEWVAFLQATKSVIAGVASTLTENSSESTSNMLDTGTFKLMYSLQRVI